MTAPNCCPKCGDAISDYNHEAYACLNKKCTWWIKKEDWPVLKESLENDEHNIRSTFRWWDVSTGQETVGDGLYFGSTPIEAVSDSTVAVLLYGADPDMLPSGAAELMHEAARRLEARSREIERRLDEARFAAWVAGCDHTRLRETPLGDPDGERAADILARLAEEYETREEE